MRGRAIITASVLTIAGAAIIVTLARGIMKGHRAKQVADEMETMEPSRALATFAIRVSEWEGQGLASIAHFPGEGEFDQGTAACYSTSGFLQSSPSLVLRVPMDSVDRLGVDELRSGAVALGDTETLYAAEMAPVDLLRDANHRSLTGLVQLFVRSRLELRQGPEGLVPRQASDRPFDEILIVDAMGDLELSGSVSGIAMDNVDGTIYYWAFALD